MTIAARMFARTLDPAPSTQAVLQRKCACGRHTGAGGECESCKSDKLHRSASVEHRPMPLPSSAISRPDDPSEREADRIAEAVMSGSMPSVAPAAEPAPVQRAATSSRVTGVPPIVNEVLASSGQPLDAATRAFFEPRFSQNLGHVRVHTGDKAAASAHAVEAEAYTAGSHVVLGQGGIHSGKQKLLAHELAHVLQQGDGLSASTTILRSGKKSSATATTCGAPWTCANDTECGVADNAIIGPMPRSSWWRLTLLIDTEAPTPADVDEGTVGHTYVEFSESNGNVYTYGFYPNPTTRPSLFRTEVDGCVVHPDTAHTSCVDYREVFSLTEIEYQAALRAAQDFCLLTPKYHAYAFNCTSFAKIIAFAAGKSLPSIRGRVGGVVVADNPNTLLEGLEARDRARASGGGRR